MKVWFGYAGPPVNRRFTVVAKTKAAAKRVFETTLTVDYVEIWPKPVAKADDKDEGTWWFRP